MKRLFKLLFKKRCNHRFEILTHDFELVDGEYTFKIWCSKCGSIELVNMGKYDNVKRALIMKR